MFQFPGLPPPALCVRAGVAGDGPRGVRPFGDPRVAGQVPLTAAYRSLSRPSSASCAKASTVCPQHLLFDVSGLHTLMISLALMRSSMKNYRLVTLCGSQGTPRASPRDRTLRPVSRRGRLRNRRVGPSVRARKKGRLLLSKELSLPRKEVIQPHVPVRLPCYDFTPLTLHTFGTSPPRGLGRRLRVQTTRVV